MLRRARGSCGGRRTKKIPLDFQFWSSRQGTCCFSSYQCFFASAVYMYPLFASQYRWIHTRVEAVHLDVDASEQSDVTLEDYEELLLNSEAVETSEQENIVDNVKVTETNEDSRQTSLSPSAMTLVKDILDLLPTDGTGLRLTTITPLVDVEAVSELCGSVLDFVRLFPHRFQTYQFEEMDGSLRWYVSRAKAIKNSLLSMSTENGTDNGGEYSVGHEPIKTKRQLQVKLHNVQTDLSEETVRVVLQQLQEILPKAKSIPTAGLLQTLPIQLQNSIRASGGGVMRFLKDVIAEEYVDLSADMTLVSVKGLLSLKNTMTYHQQLERTTRNDATPLLSPADYAEDVWDVELNLDDDDDDDNGAIPSTDSKNDDDTLEPDEDFLRVNCSVTATVPHNTSPPSCSIPPAPPKPPVELEKRKTPPPLPSRKNNVFVSPKEMSSEELLKAHTSMALLRGRRSPSEMLDLFVECVPTIYVPVQRVKVTDALAKVLGPKNTLHKVIRIYSYYFDRDKASDIVRLKPTLQHPRLGIANGFYDDEVGGVSVSKATHRKLQETNVTRAFPILQTPIRTTNDLSVTKKKDSVNKASTVSPIVAESFAPEWIALLEALPHTHYVDMSEWANTAGVPLSAVHFFTQSASKYHYFLTNKIGQGQEEKVLWRLRPYWLAPGCTGELGAENLSQVAAIAKHMKPIWLPIDRFLQKLTATERDNVAAASRHYGGVGPWLRTFGRICWVDDEGMKVRKYCATAELDDIIHVILKYLHTFLTSDFVKLEDIIRKRMDSPNTTNGESSFESTGIIQLLLHGLNVTQQREIQSTNEINGMLDKNNATQEDIYNFLLRHAHHLDVKKMDNNIWVAKRSFFRRSTGS